MKRADYILLIVIWAGVLIAVAGFMIGSLLLITGGQG